MKILKSHYSLLVLLFFLLMSLGSISCSTTDSSHLKQEQKRSLASDYSDEDDEGDLDHLNCQAHVYKVIGKENSNLGLENLTVPLDPGIRKVATIEHQMKLLKNEIIIVKGQIESVDEILVKKGFLGFGRRYALEKHYGIKAHIANYRNGSEVAATFKGTNLYKEMSDGGLKYSPAGKNTYVNLRCWISDKALESESINVAQIHYNAKKIHYMVSTENIWDRIKKARKSRSKRYARYRSKSWEIVIDEALSGQSSQIRNLGYISEVTQLSGRNRDKVKLAITPYENLEAERDSDNDGVYDSEVDVPSYRKVASVLDSKKLSQLQAMSSKVKHAKAKTGSKSKRIGSSVMGSPGGGHFSPPASSSSPFGYDEGGYQANIEEDEDPFAQFRESSDDQAEVEEDEDYEINEEDEEEENDLYNQKQKYGEIIIDFTNRHLAQAFVETFRAGMGKLGNPNGYQLILPEKDNCVFVANIDSCVMDAGQFYVNFAHDGAFHVEGLIIHIKKKKLNIR